MNLDHETLEILMGKHLDGEISGAEARLLQNHMHDNADARRLLEQLEDLHRQSQEALTETVQGRGRSAQDIIDSAMRQSQGYGCLQIVSKWVCSQFVAGLAAGLLISGAFLLGINIRTDRVEPESTAQQQTNPAPVIQTDRTPGLVNWAQQTPGVQRNVDWIVFTDQQGQHYLIEGLREDRRIRPAVYQNDF